MNKKNIKIIFVNLLLLVTLLFVFECFFYIKDINFYNKKISLNSIHYFLKKDKFENKFNSDFKIEMRKPVGLNYKKKKPVLLLGCSYAYGQFLDEKDTLGYKISEKAKRPVYNWGYPAWGIQHAYYIVRNMPKISPDPEYVFYIFMNDHLRRMYINCFREDYAENLQYRVIDGVLVKKDNRRNIFDNSHFLVNLKNFVLYFYKRTKNSQNLFKTYVHSLNDEIKEIYPNSKFVVLVFDKNNKKWKLPYKIMDELKQEGIDVFYLNDITNIDFSKDEYKLSEDKDYFRHPNAQAWEVTSDSLIKKFNL